MLGTALYYPHIDIHDTSWLRSAMLFWDGIQTIVPTAIDDPYKSADTNLCADEGYLTPLHCDLYEDVLSDLAARVIRLMDHPEWTYSAMSDLRGPMDSALIHADKLGHEMMWRLGDAVGIDPRKMLPELRPLLAGPLGLQMLSGRKVHPRLRYLLELGSGLN